MKDFLQNLIFFPGGGQFAWHGGEMTMTFKDGTSVPIETNQTGQGRPNEEVEVMSTDTSSSSSTDSN